MSAASTTIAMASRRVAVFGLNFNLVKSIA